MVLPGITAERTLQAAGISNQRVGFFLWVRSRALIFLLDEGCAPHTMVRPRTFIQTPGR